MANHFSIRALRTPWTVWKGKEIRHHGLDKLCFLVAGKSKMKELADSMYGESPLPRWPFLCWKLTQWKRQGECLDGRHDYLFGIVASCVDLNKTEVEDAILEGNQVRCICVPTDLIMEGTVHVLWQGLCWALGKGVWFNIDRTPFWLSTGDGRMSLGLSSSPC